MSGTDTFVVIVGLFIGYWIVSKLMSRSSKTPAAPRQSFGANPSDQAPPLQGQDDPSTASWSTVLGIGSNAPVEEIRRAYKVQRSQYHPDKVASLGAELRDVADRKSKEINVAYRQAMRDRGVSEQLW